MEYLKIANWDKWQSYRKDRGQPPWIKLHRELLRHPEWASLSDSQRGQLVVIWLLAADRDGAIPASASIIQKIGLMDKKPDLELFIEQGFIENDASVTPTRRQHDRTESDTETDTETETETETEGAAAINGARLDGLNILAWDEYIAYRAENKKPKLKPRTVERQQKWMVQQGHENTQRQIVDETIRNGWTGLFELKQQQKKHNGSEKDDWVGIGSKIGVKPKRGESMQNYMQRVQQGIEANASK